MENVKKTGPVKKEYSSLIVSIGTILENRRIQAYQAVNSILVKTYWEIGKRIIEYEQKGKSRAQYGSKLLDTLSRDLMKRYDKGFSRDNLEKMRKFYTLFKNSETLSRKLTWSHYSLIIRQDDTITRQFYTVEAEKESWSARELERQINSKLYERIALCGGEQRTLDLSKKGQIIESPEDIVKDPYVLEFLGVQKEAYTETDLENSIIDNLQKFLLELGKRIRICG